MSHLYPSDRRSPDPLNRLGRAFNELLSEVTDPMELAAHLEVMGYSSARVKAEFGLGDTFELAEQMFARTRRLRQEVSLQERINPPKPLEPLLQRLLVALYLPIVLAVFGVLHPHELPSALWMGAWFYTTVALMNYNRLEPRTAGLKRLLAVQLLVALAGSLMLFWVTGAPPTFWPPLLFMFSGSILIWQRAMPWLVGWSFLALISAASPLPWMDYSLAGTALVLSAFVLIWPKLWPKLDFRIPWQTVLIYALMGVGAALMLMELFAQAKPVALLGLFSLGSTLVLAELQMPWLRERLAELLWTEDSEQRYTERTWSVVLAFAGRVAPAALLSLVAVAVYGISQSWAVYLLEAALLGVVLVWMGLLAHLKQAQWAAVAGLTAGVLSFSGIPMLLVLLPAIIVLGVGLVRQIPRIYRYAAQLIG